MSLLMSFSRIHVMAFSILTLSIRLHLTEIKQFINDTGMKSEFRCERMSGRKNLATAFTSNLKSLKEVFEITTSSSSSIES